MKGMKTCNGHSGVQITRIEVWVTKHRQDSTEQDSGVHDLGEDATKHLGQWTVRADLPRVGH